MAGLPDSIYELAEFSPVEDVLLALLRAKLPAEVKVQSVIEDNQTFPMVMARRAPTFTGFWTGDDRVLDQADIDIHCFAADPDGDEDAAVLAEAVRVILRDAGRTNFEAPGKGWVRSVRMTSAPRRVPDWATATGPVQYADLPTGVHRYEAKFSIAVRKPRTGPYTSPTP